MHRYKAQADGRLRVHWLPVYEASAEQGGAEVLGDRPEHHGMKPLLENVPAKRLLCAVQLHDGVMSHAAARQLDRAGWTWKTEGVVHVSLAVGLTDSRTQLWNQSLKELGKRVGEEVLAQARCEKKIPHGVLDFVELGQHQGELTQAVRRLGFSALDGLTGGAISYGQVWPLESEEVQHQLEWLFETRLVPRAVHVSVPGARRGLHSLSTKKQKSGRSVEAFVAVLSRKLVDKGCCVSLQAPEGAPELEDGALSELVGKVDQLVAPWRHVFNTGCSFGQVLGPSPQDPLSGGPVKKGRHWVGNFVLAPIEVNCGRPRAILGSTHVHVPAFGKVMTAEGRMDATKQAAALPSALADVYARCLAKGLEHVEPKRPLVGSARPRGAVIGVLGDPTPAKNGSAAAGCMKHYVLVAGKARALDEEDYGEVLEGGSETPEVRQAREETLVKEAAVADVKWRKLASEKDWTRVVANLEVYAYSGEKVTVDPRLADEYRDKVVAELGFGPDWRSKRTDLTDEDVVAIREVLHRKASAFWLEGTPRTTVRFVQHDTVPTGPPVKLPPHNLKGEAAAWVDAKLEEEVRRGQLERGVSAWGSPPFPTKDMPEHKKSRKRRIVVDYRRVDARTRRAVYHVRTAASVICEAAGSIWMSMLDAVTGFNHIVNTPRAKRMLAIVARSGHFLGV